MTRSVLVIGDESVNDLMHTLNVLPITTRKNGRMIYPNEVFLDKHPGIGKINHIYFAKKMLIHSGQRRTTSLFMAIRTM